MSQWAVKPEGALAIIFSDLNTYGHELLYKPETEDHLYFEKLCASLPSLEIIMDFRIFVTNHVHQHITQDNLYKAKGIFRVGIHVVITNTFFLHCFDLYCLNNELKTRNICYYNLVPYTSIKQFSVERGEWKDIL
jgi:hypothetical protein